MVDVNDLVGDRLTVRLQPLELRIGVRIPAGLPTSSRSLHSLDRLDRDRGLFRIQFSGHD